MAKLAEGRFSSPVSLASQMRRSQRPAAAIEGFEEGHVVFGVVGDEELVAMAVDVAEGELGAWMGLFAPHEHAGALGPAAQIHQVRDLGCHPGVTLVGSVGRNGRHPAVLRDVDDQAGQIGAEAVPHDEADATLTTGVDEAVAGPGRVGPGDDLGGHWVHRQLGQRGVEQGHVVLGRSGRGIARAQDGSQGLARGVEEGDHGLEAEAVLVVRRRTLLVGVGIDEVASMSMT